MRGEGDLDDAIRPERHPRWRAVADLATRQHGTITHEQLVRIGFSPRGIARHVAAGHLLPIHRGVYAVGHRALTMRGRWMAGVLACGPRALLSHRAGAALLGVRPPVERIDVTAPTHRRRRAGLRIHRADVPEDERTVADGIPVTSILRVLLDLAATDGRHQAERAAHEAEARGIADVLSPARFLARHAGERGVGVLRDVLADPRLGLDLTESPLEERFVVFLDAHALPRPQLNAHVVGRRRDAAWPQARLVAELDGRRWHRDARRFEDDRLRDRVLQVAGWRTVRITHRMLEEDPASLAADLRVLLTGRAAA